MQYRMPGAFPRVTKSVSRYFAKCLLVSKITPPSVKNYSHRPSPDCLFQPSLNPQELSDLGQIISPPSTSIESGWKIWKPPCEVAERAEAVGQDLACLKAPRKGRCSFNVYRVPGFFPFSLSFSASERLT